jgi:hypothetical protein
VSISEAKPGPPSARPVPSAIRYAAVVVLSGGVAALAMLAVGWAFNTIEKAIPSIPAEYKNPAVFRDWPGWTEGYMLAHPIWFGFVFAAGFLVVTRGRVRPGWVFAGCCGAAYGGLLFLVGSLPVFALVYASFQVSRELVAVSWAGRNLAQYVVAGGLVGLVTRAGLTIRCCCPGPPLCFPGVGSCPGRAGQLSGAVRPQSQQEKSGGNA